MKAKPAKRWHADLVDWIDGYDAGVSSVLISEHFSKDRIHVREVLRRLRKQGKVLLIGTAPKVFWCTARNAAKAREAYMLDVAQSKERNKAHKLEMRRWYRLREDADPGCELPVTQRVVPASSAPRIECKAPRSVFDLGSDQ